MSYVDSESTPSGLPRRVFLRNVAQLVAASSLTAVPGRAALAQAKVPKPAPLSAHDEILNGSARNLAALIRAKKISSVEAVTACLKRIEEVNPRLNAVVLVTAERALREARDADTALARGNPNGPLHGVPLTVSDAFETAGVISTGGTLGRKTFMPAHDAAVVNRLRDAGAILLGKTNVGELAIVEQTDNLIYGRTYNPYDVSRVPGGSMGGAAAIVAAGGAPFDIGSDITGGLRIAAHYCGATALKPTHGCVPRTGHVIDYCGLVNPYLQVGVMARWVEDLALILPIIAGPDASDPAVVPVPQGKLDDVKLDSLRVAFYTQGGGESPPSPQTVEVLKSVADMLSAAGMKVKEDRPKDLLKETDDVRAKYDGADDRAWVKREIEKLGTKSTHGGLPLGGNLVVCAEFTLLAEKIDSCRSRLLQWLAGYDVVLCPVDAQPAHSYRGEGRSSPDPSKEYGYTGVFNVTGWPVAVVRAGTSPEGLPIGVQIVGRPWREDVVLAVSRLVESKFGGWKAPSSAKTKSTEEGL